MRKHSSLQNWLIPLYIDNSEKGPIFSMEDQEILCWIKFKFHVITNLRNLEKNLHILLYTPSHTHTVTSTSLDRSALVLSVVQMSIYPIVQCQYSENMQMVSTIITIMPWIVSKIITRTVRLCVRINHCTAFHRHYCKTLIFPGC